MKKVLCMLFLCAILCSCERENSNIESHSGWITSLDTLIIQKSNLPAIRNFLYFDSMTVSIFQTIANGTYGKMYLAENANLVIDVIIEIIDNHGGDNIDLCFLIDKTASMVDDINMLHTSMDIIFAAIKKYKNINVGLVYYGDKNVDGNSWIEVHDFNQNFNDIEENFKTVRYSGGGDKEESLTDAAHIAINELSWSSTEKRIILVLGDAPSLSPPLASYSINDIISEAKSNDIVTNYYPVVIGFAGLEIGPMKENLIATVYPNPSSSIVNLLFENEDEYLMEIFTMNGVLLESKNVNKIKEQINVTNYNQGVYILRISKLDGSLVDSRKIIVRK